MPSKALADPGELDRALTASLTSGLTDSFVASATAGAAPNVFQVKVLDKGKTNWKKFEYVQKRKGLMENNLYYIFIDFSLSMPLLFAHKFNLFRHLVLIKHSITLHLITNLKLLEVFFGSPTFADCTLCNPVAFNIQSNTLKTLTVKCFLNKLRVKSYSIFDEVLMMFTVVTSQIPLYRRSVFYLYSCFVLVSSD